MNSSIERPIVLISGATRGIGLAAARLLTERGATVIVGSRDLGRAQKTAEQLGSEAIALQLDITDADSLNAAALEIENRFGRLDVLFNNAAVLLDHHESLMTLEPKVLTETLATNVVGTLRVTQTMASLLAKSKAPRIVNVSSGAGQLDGEPQDWAPAYCISKTALNMLTQQLTAALPDTMINSMCPGWCRTEMGGLEAPLSAEEGADTLVWLTLEAPHSLRGQFIKKRQPIPW